jgi:large subunit ribosomal protein L32e
VSGQEGGLRHRAPSRSKKRKKPKFKRQESWRYKRVKENWRRPRGLDSKMRKKVKGWPPSPNKGYRSPRESRDLHPSGLREVRVMNVGDLDNVDPKSEAVRIGHRVGDRKRIEIINRAREMGIHVLNPKEIEVEA